MTDSGVGFDKAGFEQRVRTGLKQCLNDHGPITPLLLGSAAKRISGCVYGWLRRRGVVEHHGAVMGVTAAEWRSNHDEQVRAKRNVYAHVKEHIDALNARIGFLEDEVERLRGET